MNERKLIKEFLEKANSGVCLACGQNPCACIELCGSCHCDPCKCPGHSEEECMDHMQDYSLDSSHEKNYQASPAGDSHHDLDPDGDGYITPEDLYAHFDLNNNGQVTPQEYVDHIKYHAAYPESLDHYNTFKEKSYDTVPCRNSYDSCSSHLLSQPDDVSMILSPLMDKTGSTCQISTAQSLLDVLQSLINCGVIG